MAIEKPLSQIPQFILQALQRALEEEYNDAAEKAVEAFKKDIETRRDKVIAGVMLNISQRMSIHDMNDRLVLEIIKREQCNTINRSK